jgi:diaminopimelate decarboxylase
MVESSFTPLETTRIEPIFSDDEIVRMTNEYGTPIFLIDELTMINRLKTLQNAYSGFEGNLKVAYSMKANFNPYILKVFSSKKILFDVTSIGELYFYIKSNGDPANIIYTSVTEEKYEFEKVLKTGGRRFVIGSYRGLENLVVSANDTGITIDVIIRINPEVDVKAVVKAAHRNSKFGVPLSNGNLDSAHDLLKRILQEPKLKFEGFHFHLGSQIEDISCYLNALDKLEIFIDNMKEEFPNLTIRTIDIGGGTPVFYGTPIPSPELIGNTLTKRLNSMIEHFNERYTLIIESGRYLSAESSVLVSKIVNIKSYTDQEFIYIDSGFHLLLDAALLRQAYPQYIIPKSLDYNLRKLNLVGRLCDTYDIFPISQNSDLKGAAPGKLIVFQNVGAYSIVFGMPFHCQTKPPVFIRKLDGAFKMIRPSQSIEELFAEEGGKLSVE